MKKIISLLLLCLLLTACTEKFKTIATNEAIELIDNGAPDDFIGGARYAYPHLLHISGFVIPTAAGHNANDQNHS